MMYLYQINQQIQVPEIFSALREDCVGGLYWRIVLEDCISSLYKWLVLVACISGRGSGREGKFKKGEFSLLGRFSKVRLIPIDRIVIILHDLITLKTFS